MATERKGVGQLKEKSFVLIDGEPCEVVNSDHSKPGKHGGAKCRVTAIGIFDGRKREFVQPAGDSIEVPIIEKGKAQVLSIRASSKQAGPQEVPETILQLMDLQTFETFELPKPADVDVVEGGEVAYINFEGRKKITRSTGGT